MFGNNGKNNGNGAVHVNGAAKNGNGHKPGAAIPAEHDLLWDGLSPAVTQALGQPIDPSLVSQRKGRGGRTFDYLEGHAVIDQANRIFGYGGWGYELVGDVTLRRIETVDTQTGEVTVSQAYSAPVRVTVAGALPRTDTGVHPVAEDTVDGHDTAIKGAVTDGMKRAFRSFGAPVRKWLLRRPVPGQRRAQPERARPGQPQRQACPGAGPEPRRGAGREAAQAAHGAVRQAGLRRGRRCRPPSRGRRARASTT